ncbi:unnamed protein product [Closterium sp. NIES-53]
MRQTTRPDIAFATSRAVRQRQQRGAADLGKGEMLLTCYTDASFNSVKADGTSIGGYVCLFEGGAVSWHSKKQNEVGLSSCETKYIALHHGVKEVVCSSCEAEIYAGAMAAQELRWLTYLVTDLGEQPHSPPILVSTCTQLFASSFILVHYSYIGGIGAVDPGARGTGAAGAGGVGGAGTGGAGAGCTGAGCTGAGVTGARGAGAGDPGAGGAGAVDPGAGGAGAGGAASGGTGAGGTVQRRPFFVPLPPSSLPPPDSVLRKVLCLPSSTGLPPRLLSPPPRQSQPQLHPDSPLLALSGYTKQNDSCTERREPTSRPASPVCAVCNGRRVPCPRPPPVPGTHVMALRSSSIPLRVPLPPPPMSSLPAIPDLESDLARDASPTVSRLLAIVVIDPSFESTAASALVAELVDFAAVCRLDYATSLVAESEYDCPSSVRGECAPGTDVLEDKQEEFECLIAAVPHLVAMLLAPEGDPDAPDIRPRALTQRRLRAPNPFNADPSLFLHTDTSLPPFYILVYVDDLVFATAGTVALALVNSELQKRHTCIDMGELRSYLGLQITWDRARRTITLTQSHMVHQVLQRFGFRYSSPQSTPLPTGHSLSAPPLDESVEPSGLYPELVGCLMYLMTCTRPDLAYPLSILAHYVAPGIHRPEHWEAAKRVLRYLCSTSGMGLVLGGRGPVSECHISLVCKRDSS